MDNEDEIRAAIQRELTAISDFRSLKAEACSVRKKLEEDMATVIKTAASTSCDAVQLPGVTNASKDVENATRSTASAEQLAKREKIRAEREEVLRQLRAEIMAEKQTPPFLVASSPCPSPSHSTRSPSPGNRELSSECSSVVGGTGPEDPIVDETASLPKAAGKGKGRPSGKGRPLPPPGASKGGTPRESWPKGKGKGSPGKGGKDRAEGERTPGGTRLVNLHWRTSLEPEETELSAAGDSYLAGMVEMLPKQCQAAKQCRESLAVFEKKLGITDAFCLNYLVDDDRTPIRSASSPLPGEREAVTPTFTPNHLDTTPTAAITPAKNLAGQASPNPTNRRRRRNTIFSGECAVRELPHNKLEEFFQVKPTAVDMGSRASMGTVRTLIRDTKHLQIIDILVKKEAIMSKRVDLTRQKSEEAAVEELLLALRRCDYKRCPPPALDVIRTVTAAHMADRSNQNVLQFVESRGEEALQQLDHPHLHRLLYGVLQIPAVDARLECMVMDANSEESFKHCYANLMTLGTGLETLVKVIEPLRHFFAAVRTMGNSINQECSNASAAVSGFGVKMSSIAKFMELKSPVQKEVSLFHLVVLTLPPTVVEKLVEKSVIEELSRAKLARSFTVYQVCTQFLDGFRQIRHLVETGRYKDEEIPVDVHPRGHTEGEPVSDVFFEHMRTFVASRQEQADQIARLCSNVFEKYRAFGFYLDDWKYFYPPPSDESQASQPGEEKRDLFEFFHWLLTNMRQTKEDIAELKLDAELALKRTMGKSSTSENRRVSTPNLPPAPPAPPIGATRIDGLASAETNPEETMPWRGGPQRENPLSPMSTNLASTVAPDVSSPEDVSRTKAKEASPVPVTKTSLCTSSSMRVLVRPASPPPSAHVTSVPVTATQTSAPSSTSCRSPGRSDPSHSPPSSYRVGGGDCNSARDSQHASCMEDMTSPLCPPPRRRVGPVGKLSTVESPTVGMSSRGLVLPGVHRAGTPRPQSSLTSVQGHESPPTLKSNGSESGKASDNASPTNSPSRTTRKCRKSVTNLANKAERQGISRVLGESAMPDSSRSRTSSLSSPRSPCASSDGGTDSEHSSLVVGFAAEIREGARMIQGRFYRGQHALELPAMGDDELGGSPRTWRNCRSPDARTPGNNKYALSPVWEHASEASHSVTPARRYRHYEHMSPVPMLHQLQECS